jgi:feruloyl esterase
VFEDLEWDWRTFDYDADLAAARAKLGDVMDAMDADLRPFKRRGGKLLLYHGWSDFGISPEATRRYYERVTETVGSRAATEDFARLLLIPGMGHCRGGTGPDTFDGLTPLVDWVERGVAPERIVAAQIVDGEVVRTRPLCPYPKVASWTGTGTLDDAANFECQEP